MTVKKWGQGILATAVSAGLGLGLASCGQSNTIDYVYLLSSKNSPGQINVYATDSITGALTQMAGSPFNTGNDPVGAVVTYNGKMLYVINQVDNSVVPYTIGSNGMPTEVSSGVVTTPGSKPIAVGINQAATFLFVIDGYAPGYSASTPGPGAIIVYPISSSGALGTPVSQTVSGLSTPYYPLGNSPSAINVLNNGDQPTNNCEAVNSGDTSCSAQGNVGNYVYVTEQLTAPAAGCTTGQGGVRGFQVNSSGVLALVSGSPFCAGVTPSGAASTPISRFLYVTDSAQNQLIGYTISSSTTPSSSAGALTPFVGGPVATGTFPDAIAVDQTGQYIYVANRFANSLQSYSIAQGTGIPASTGSYPTDAFPQNVMIDPALNRFVYTADFEGIGTTGYQLNPNTGVLTGTENSPYPGSGQSTFIVAVPHNQHPIIQVTGSASQ